MSKCGNCNIILKSNTAGIHCDACQAPIHIHCVGGGLTEQDIKVTRSKSKSIKVVCNTCERNMASFGDLKSLINDLRNEWTTAINNLKLEVQEQINTIQSSLNEQKSSSTPDFETVVQEVLERQKRGSNIIVYNLPEHPASIPKLERLANDKQNISNLINSLDDTVDTSNPNCFRLGKFSELRARPIKVVLQSEEDVFKLIRKAKNLSTTQEFKNIRIPFDRTPKQQELYNQLKKKLKDRIEQGESNLKIRYRNGTPTIVNLN
ncbi:hypothetical protein Zmor_001665 [Zophobas morio]|uniref:Zinc finger PHD-type domain-containing protein n=1 Tax=Zophobas morio TaxID=2755281 RepID=A0AA38IYY0_9CUCU|nr:hypothetical protein Zmor_001665 [Zophobas morio]